MPIAVPAPKYVDYLMDWIEAQLDDGTLFPQHFGNLLIFLFIWVGYLYSLMRIMYISILVEKCGANKHIHVQGFLSLPTSVMSSGPS
jgi:hypothetical protein